MCGLHIVVRIEAPCLVGFWVATFCAQKFSVQNKTNSMISHGNHYVVNSKINDQQQNNLKTEFETLVGRTENWPKNSFRRVNTVY